MSPPPPVAPRAVSVRRLPLAGVLRANKPSDIWFKPATSVVVSAAIPNVTLLALGRLDLVMYTMAGSFCALYGHNLPYAARARALAAVVLGMVASIAVALVAASFTSSAVLLVTVGALLAAAQKALCDATRIGPPGHLIFTFISSATLFAPQRVGQVPGHLALTLGAGAVAWLVGMAPALVRPHGPERRATARA
ncbi:FUSC family protein, partial [Streptomyces sp. SID14478]|nr:FUSC family protein [Streptomyces sp. SID14478]